MIQYEAHLKSKVEGDSAMAGNKAPAKKIVTGKIGPTRGPWKGVGGYLKPGRGNPGKVENLFTLVAEKIPFAYLEDVRRAAKENGNPFQGVYVAHDSMGWPRYIGRGDVFGRLKSRKKVHSQELHYFSLYIIRNKKHTREIETLMIRTAGSLLSFNDKKKRQDQMTGRVTDYEANTEFAERQSRKGKPVATDPL
jgi:hypothetical protein